jgi:two-component system, chemotaxis family, CheB/CheR fusion protein
VANAFLESVLTSFQGVVIVVDRDLRVLAWNSQAEQLWGLREAEVNGQHLLNLDIGLPLDRLKPVLKSCLNGDGEGQALPLEAVDRSGRAIDVSCTPLRGPADEIRGAILIMEVSAGASS